MYTEPLVRYPTETIYSMYVVIVFMYISDNSSSWIKMLFVTIHRSNSTDTGGTNFSFLDFYAHIYLELAHEAVLSQAAHYTTVW